MPSSESKKTKHDIEEGYGLDREQVSRKKSAKSRKRELENMYASEPINTYAPMGYSKTKMASSLPTHLNGVALETTGKSNQKISKSKGDRHNGAFSPATSLRGYLNQNSENSIWIDELVRSNPVLASPVPSKDSRGSKAMTRELSRQLSRQASMHRPDAPPKLLRQTSRNSTGLGNTQQTGKRTDFSNSERPPRGRDQSLQRGRSRGRSHSTDRSHSSRTSHSRGRSVDWNSNIGSNDSMHRSGFQRSHSFDASKRLSLEPSPRRGSSLDRSTKLDSSNLSPRKGARPTLSSHLSRSRSVTRTVSGTGSVFRDGNASLVGSIATINGQKIIVLSPGSIEQAGKMGIPVKSIRRRGIRRFIPKEVEEKPPRSLIIIWAIVAAELGFDFATTVIAFNSFLTEETCCGSPIQLGSLPMATTVPFFMLIVAELTFLLRAIALTLWPSMMKDEEDNEVTDSNGERQQRSRFRRYLCCFFRFKIKVLLQFLNLMVLLNPFLGCIIAWMLMYQSDKKEAFIVLGMEGASLILHFISVKLEGGLKTWKQIAFNCIPVLPFAFSIGLVLFYLKEGGVCYLVDQKLFKFTGCEICDINGVLMPCPNSTNIFSDITNQLDSFQDVKDSVLGRSIQGTYCATNPEERSFCFYDYNDGQTEMVNLAEWTDSLTPMPTELLPTQAVTLAPVASPGGEDGPTGSDTDSTSTPLDPTVPPVEPTVPPVEPTLPPVEPTLPPVEQTLPPEASITPPTQAPILPPTFPPTSPVQTSSPTSVSVTEPTEGGSGEGEDGSDGFNMDEVGSDSFNPVDLFG